MEEKLMKNLLTVFTDISLDMKDMKDDMKELKEDVKKLDKRLTVVEKELSDTHEIVLLNNRELANVSIRLTNIENGWMPVA